VPSRWSPPVASDVRRAWEGSFAADPDVVFRVEAAAYRGRPVAFYQVMPWTRPERDQGAAFSQTRSIGVGAGLALLFLLLTVGAVIARRHARAGRSDRAGASRLAIVAFSLGFTSYCLAAHHLPSQTDEFEILTRAAGSALLVTAIVWILYLALEPIVRRLWPHALISWTRLLSRGPFDPLVGRDVLLGTAAGALVALLLVFAARLPAWVGHPATEPGMPESGLYALLGLRYGLSSVIIQPLASINVAVGSLLLLALLRLLLRREWLAATVFVIVIGTLESLQWDLPWGLALPVAALIMGTFVIVGLRLGLLAFVVTAFTTDLAIGLTTTSDLASWSAGPTRLVAATVLGLAVCGFALARRPSGRGLTA